MRRRIQILDCTLRDGGFANDFNFGDENIRIIAEKLSDSEVEIIEMGFVDINSDMGNNYTRFSSFTQLERFIPKSKNILQQISGMISDYEVFPIERIPEKNKSRCDMIRIMLRYSQLQKSLDYCEEVAKKGYKICIQPAITMRYTRNELQMLFNTANKINAYGLYIVDSYGYMQQPELRNYFKIYDENLEKTIRIGFHAHNNMNLAFSNSLDLYNLPTEREIMIDSSLLGMGQGAGNLQTELFIGYLNKHFGMQYNYDAILEGCEIIGQYFSETSWGYSVVDAISAIYRTSYKYSRSLRKEYSLSFVEINRLLSTIPENIRHQYANEHIKQLIALKSAGLPV